jgi:hypothetical protein
MGFGDIETRDLGQFIKSNASPETLWIFLHIPKTAGSSFGTELAIHKAPYRNIHVDYEDREQPYNEQLDRAVTRFLAEHKRVPYSSASGHLPYAQVDRIIKAVPDTKVVTILREPVARVISDYRYQRTPAHPPFKDFIAEFPTIESYIETEESQNKMFRFLAPPGTEASFDEGYKHIQKNMTFIGLLEMYPMSFNVLFRLFGSGDRLPVEHQRKTVTTKDNEVDISPALTARIKALNSLDVKLFDRVRSTLVGRREAWVDLRKREAAKAG